MIFDETAQRLASLVGTVALVRHFPLRRTPAGLTKTYLKGNHWVYGGVSTASATLTVYSRAGQVGKAHEAPARYRRDLRTIVKGDVQGPKHRPDTSPLSDGPAVVVLSKLKGVPVISTRGLAPVDFDSWVVTSCYRAGPGVQVRRKLSLEEKLAVLDVPQAGIDLLVSLQWEHCALGLAPAMLLGGLWGDFLCHEGGDLPRRTVQLEESLLGKRSPVETGLEPPAGQRRKVTEQIVEKASLEATVSASSVETGSGGAKTDCVIVETVSEEIFGNSSKAMNSASSVETGSGGSKVDCVMAEGPSSKTLSVGGLAGLDCVMAEGPSSKTLPVGGLAGLVVETVLDEETPAAAILLEDSSLGVESDLQDSPVPPGNDSAARRSKATKSDSDEAPVFMWSEFLFKRVFKAEDSGNLRQTGDWPFVLAEASPLVHARVPSDITYGNYLGEERMARVPKAMVSLRKLAIRWWRRNITRSFIRHMREGMEARLQSAREKGETTFLDLPRDARDGDVEHCHGVKRAESGEFAYCLGVKGRHKYMDWYLNLSNFKSEDWLAGQDAVARAAGASWWDWTVGSRLFFWRWPKWYQRTALEGMPVFYTKHLKNYTAYQPDEWDEDTKDKQGKKLNKVLERRYVSLLGTATLTESANPVKSWTSFFSVPKGEDDIRMVYDASKSGLNDSIWVPRFPLPTINTHLRAVEPGTWMGDLDIGEMFLNFPLHSSLQKLCGVDLTHYVEKLSPKVLKVTPAWAMRQIAWTRCAMGLRSSPYQAVQGALVAEEMVLGNPGDQANVFRWDRVVTNLPGSDSYDPRRSWVYKVRRDGSLAADLFTYVDDQRACAANELDCISACRRCGSMNNFLGVQDAPRKRRDPNMEPGPWSGSVITTDGGLVCVLITNDKWLKAQGYVEELEAMQEADKPVSRKRLETIRGFLQYITRTYPNITPYMKGLHLTIDGWRPDRDADGWRKKKKSFSGSEPRAAGLGEAVTRDSCSLRHWVDDETGWIEESLNAPAKVTLKPRMADDVLALKKFFGRSHPPRRLVRGIRVIEAFYGFGDASGAGFGASFGETEDATFYRFGQWCTSVSEESSNYRELRNLVESLREFLIEKQVRGAEIFLFTDNSVAEAAYWKGNSSSRKLFELVLEMKQMEYDFELQLHVVHVSGKRMIAQGTDGLSRADFSEGVMAGKAMTSFIPLHLDCEERAPGMGEWLQGLLKEVGGASLLDPSGWFRESQAFGNFVRTPAPAAAEVVVEQLGKARHKRPGCFHIVAVPRLMTGRWRRAMGRECNFYFKIPPGSALWPTKMYEPLLVYVCLPFVPHRPWVGSQRAELDSLVGELLQEGVWETAPERCRSLLCKFLSSARTLSGVPECVV